MTVTVTLEFHAATGGDDAAMFAAELADAVARHARTTPENAGRVIVLHRL